MDKTLILLLLSVLWSCGNNNSATTTNVDNPQTTESYIIPTDSTTFYFPTTQFENDSFLLSWYSEHLFSMHEPLLYNAKTNKEVYRLTWLRTWGQPIAIRIEKSTNDFLIFLKVTNGQGGYGPGKLIIDKKRSIDEQTWNNFKNKLQQANFWRLATKDSNIGLDGSQWVLEGKLADKYHVVDRWSPKGGSYYDCCMYLINLVKTDIDNKK